MEETTYEVEVMSGQDRFKRTPEPIKRSAVDDEPAMGIAAPAMEPARQEVENQPAKSAVTNPNDPTYEDVTLPSKGLYYSGLIPGGVIKCRMMYQEEEDILNSVRHVQSGKVADMIFERVVRGLPINTTDLLSGDRTYLLLWLRITSYGQEYATNVTCPFTSKQFEHTFDLSTLKLLPGVDEDGEQIEMEQEPFELLLPRKKCKIWFRLPRGNDEMNLSKESERRMKEFGPNALDNPLTRRMQMLTVKMQLPDGKITDSAPEIRAGLKNVPAGDAALFREELSYRSPGVDLTCTISSPFNGQEFQIQLPFGADFFSVKTQRRRKK